MFLLQVCVAVLFQHLSVTFVAVSSHLPLPSDMPLNAYLYCVYRMGVWLFLLIAKT